ncbi:MAG: hypothetical protein JXA11_12185 [Phycisphaerae bacterium]|nr:hypothetical protein [Phycisphaerae bacterium]
MADNEPIHNKLIARLTDRLAGDPELQADVAHELQTHLEDAEEEFREAGLDDEKAQQEAVKAMGDPEEISQQLFQANRTRMRFRAVIRWTASLALLPAAMVVVAVLFYFMTGGGIFDDIDRLTTSIQSGQLGENAGPFHWSRQLSEEDIFVLQGDIKAGNSIEREKSISNRWPDDPVYYGNYFVAAVSRYYGKDGQLRASFLKKSMEMADHGEKVDPDNAFYNFIKAGWLIEASCMLEDDPSRQIESIDSDEKRKSISFYKITITDPVGFQQGIKELRRGLLKSFYSSRSLDMLELRLSLLPPPQSMADIISRVIMEVSALLPPMTSFRALGKILGAYAVDLAEAGDITAVELARSVEKMANLIGSESRTFIEILVALACRMNALASLELVGKELHNPTLSKNAFQERRQQGKFWRDLRDNSGMDRQELRKELRHAGMFWSVLMPGGVAGYRAEYEPLRTVECFVVLEIALLILLVGMVLLSCSFGLPILIWLISCRRSESRPILLFVGWRRIGRIVLISIVLPLVVYGLYVSWQIFRPDAYGLNHAMGRWMVELAIFLCAVFFLLLSTSYRAIHQRCEEIGVPVPPTITRRKRIGFLIAAGLVLLVCGTYIIGWWAGPFQLDDPKGEYWIPPLAFLTALIGRDSNHSKFLMDFFLVLVMLCFFIIWLLSEGVELFRRGRKAFRRTFIRSSMPILCSAVIVVGLAVGSVLSLGERCAAKRVTGNAAFGILSETERGGIRLLREKFLQWRREDGTQAAGSGEQAAGQR